MLSRFIHRGSVVIALGLLTNGVAAPQETQLYGPATLNRVVFTPRPPTEELVKARKGRKTKPEPELLTFKWERPANVRFIMVAGCGGGGGGGAGGLSTQAKPIGGDGGSAADYETKWFGPLGASSYEIVLGAGGLSQEPGSETVLSGSDLTVQFQGGLRKGARLDGESKQGKATWVTRGDALPQGGAAGTETVVPNTGGSGGDASPFGTGGPGGAVGEPGGDALGLCAGGGGGGASRYGDDTGASGGRGGDGYLEILPLVDVSIVYEQVTRLLEALANTDPARTGQER